MPPPNLPLEFDSNPPGPRSCGLTSTQIFEMTLRRSRHGEAFPIDCRPLLVGGTVPARQRPLIKILLIGGFLFLACSVRYCCGDNKFQFINAPAVRRSIRRITAGWQPAATRLAHHPRYSPANDTA